MTLFELLWVLVGVGTAVLGGVLGYRAAGPLGCAGGSIVLPLSIWLVGTAHLAIEARRRRPSLPFARARRRRGPPGGARWSRAGRS